MLIATVITVAIVNTSQLITQRISLLLDRQASELLAADLVVMSANPFADEYSQQARSLGLRLSTTASLRTAVFIEDDAQLVELKAVDSHYPLRGYLEKSVDLANDKMRVQQGRAQFRGATVQFVHVGILRHTQQIQWSREVEIFRILIPAVG